MRRIERFMEALAVDDAKVRQRVWMAWHCFILAALQGTLMVVRPGDATLLLRVQQICFLLAFVCIGRWPFWIFASVLVALFGCELSVA